ncbi:hypothetical protein [Engelhardtia mirabilis]|uniref:Uncharacterized protein n=1 Tax=Engelhardtia mirabilis TaxID=2528011 RepID=A0A518BKU1_9BACT|nr:hypothetical protein Pla133_26760 [Planctomycetes bacterium Pla133]QDV01914.1 hypothetical protein Pla86_26750 [Planctomycetes bacterium Pla86]
MTAHRHFRPGTLLAACGLLLTLLVSGLAGGSLGSAPIHASTASSASVAESVLPAAARGWHPSDGPDADVRIWIDEGAIRFRVEANLAFADAMLDVPREFEDHLDEVEREPLVKALFAAYREHNRVTVDGVQIDPVLGDWRVLDALEEFIPLFPLNGARALTRIRIEYEYPLLGTPRYVSLVWGLYPVDTVARLGPDGPKVAINAQLNAGGFDYPVQFTEGEPEYIWHGELPTADEVFLPVPAAAQEHEPVEPPLGGLALGVAVSALGALGLRRKRRLWPAVTLGLGLAVLVLTGLEYRAAQSADEPLQPAEALAVFEPLHENIYRAFRFDDESRIYDALARSVDGELLERLYQQVYRSLVNEEEGGAVSRVEALRRIDSQVDSIGELDDGRRGFTVTTRWQVDGAVIHWGHAHRRTQEYGARYTVAENPAGAETGAGWRIVSSEILDQQIVSATPGLEEEIGETGGPATVAPASREL